MIIYLLTVKEQCRCNVRYMHVIAQNQRWDEKANSNLALTFVYNNI